MKMPCASNPGSLKAIGTPTASSSLAGSLASLGKTDEAKALAKRGIAKFPGLLTIERFALNRGWSPATSKVMADLMRKAGFPACATNQELADTPKPVRLPECAS